MSRHTSARAGAVSSQETAASRCAHWISAASVETLPCAVLDLVRDSIVDTLGVSLAGARHPASEKILRVVEAVGGQEQAQVFGTGLRSSAVHAAMPNAYTAHVLDFDDTHTQAIAHVSAPVLAAAWAAAQASGAAGVDLLAAHAVGMEVCSRMARAMSGRDDHGWHLTGVAGTLGAAAAASRAYRLCSADTASALAIASTMTSGMRVHRGTGAKSMSPAHAASSGVLAAVSAAAGISGNTAFFEHPRHGFLRTFGFDGDPAGITRGLGEDFSLLGIAAKPYPSGVTSHPAIECALEVCASSAATVLPELVEKVTVRVNPLGLELTGNPAPQSGLESKFSIVHAVSVALLDRRVTLDSFSDASVARDDVRSMLQRIQVTSCEDLAKDEAAMRVDLTSGEVLQTRTRARGSSTRPLTSHDIRQKFLELHEDAAGTARSARILDGISALQEEPDLDVVSGLLAG